MKRIDCFDDFTEQDLIGKPCWSGLDLSLVDDFTALAHVFPLDDRGELFRVLVRYWLPEETVRKRADLVPIRHWIDRGWVIATEGNQTDFGVVRDGILADAEKFELRELRFDPFIAAPLIQQVQGHAFEPLEFRQTIMNFTGPTKLFERLVLGHAMLHNGNECLTWQIGNTTVVSDANQNIRPIKPKKGDPRTIDGVVAAIMALHGASQQTGGASFYDENEPELI